MSYSRHSLIAAVLTALILALALPVQARYNRQINRQAQTGPLQGYTVPLSNGTTSLPPSTGTLKAITLGIGTQNYTCSSASPAPHAIGAKAVLIDLSKVLHFFPPAKAMEVVQRFTTWASSKTAEEILKALPLLFAIGEHFFNGLGIPTFQIGSIGTLEGAKQGDIVAPKAGAVDWLKLGDAGGSTGVSQAYRVETAGGKPPVACEAGVDAYEIPYAALYWFYE